MTLRRQPLFERALWCWCSAVWLEFGRRLLSPAKASRGQRGLEAFLEGFFCLSNSFFQGCRCKQLQSEMLLTRREQRGFAELHLQRFGINWHTGKDVFLVKEAGKDPLHIFSSNTVAHRLWLTQHSTAAVSDPQWKQTQWFLFTWGTLSIGGERTEEFNWECRRWKMMHLLQRMVVPLIQLWWFPSSIQQKILPLYFNLIKGPKKSKGLH